MSFKPSDVRMWRAVLPLIDTFGHAETEFAAALMVLTCKAQGNEWQPVSPRQVGFAMKNAGELGGELHHLSTFPMLPHPDVHRLVADGFATFLGDPEKKNGEDTAPIRFTPKGYEVLRRTTRGVCSRCGGNAFTNEREGCTATSCVVQPPPKDLATAARTQGAEQILVTVDGYTQLPEAMRRELELGPGGTHVWFLRGNNVWEAWPEDKLEALLSSGAGENK